MVGLTLGRGKVRRKEGKGEGCAYKNKRGECVKVSLCRPLSLTVFAFCLLSATLLLSLSLPNDSFAIGECMSLLFLTLSCGTMAAGGLDNMTDPLADGRPSREGWGREKRERD
ncbi:MAG: hypothetical protein JOS17DRAFT_752618 [Linnemannia elongata]|nr:MAG: hypothetical protein JOS17DRAFT_752618 [Linnemannia elongata]